MACLLGHKWNFCTCTKCGATRDENHSWEPMEGRWHEKCSVCGKTRKAKPYNGVLNAQCMSSDDLKIIDDALTFIINLNANGNPNTVNECTKLMSKLSQKPSILTTSDLQLATTAVIQYAKSIPTLIEVNPQYVKHKAELQKDYEYMGSWLLPELTRLFQSY